MNNERTESTQRPWSWHWHRQWRLTKKEWAETLRDRRTLFTLILMPVLVYPLLSIVFRQFLLNSYGKQGEAQLLIGVKDEPTANQLMALLRTGDKLLQNESQSALLKSIEPPWVDEPAVERIRIQLGSSERLLKANRVDLTLETQVQADGNVTWEMKYAAGTAISSMLRSFVARRLRAAYLLRHPANIEHVVQHTPVDVRTAARSLLPTLVPLILLMMTITGAVYPAIDVTAGERERGTLEALIAAPVSRVGLLLAKYVAVVTVALLTALVNLCAMTITIHSAGLSETLFGTTGLPVVLIGQVLALLLLFAGFFSAVLLAITSFARSFKEAQAYLIPLMLLTLAPGLMSLSPSLELNALLAITPLMNVVLLARDLFSGTVDPLLGMLVIISTLGYSVLAIMLAARIFGSDAIFNTPLRSSTQVNHAHELVPSGASVGICLLLGFVLSLQLGGSVPQFMASFGLVAQVTAVGVITAGVFMGLPLVALWREKIPVAPFLQLSLSAWWHLLGACCLGLSLGVLVMEVTLISMHLGLTSFNEAFQQALQKRVTELNSLPLGVLWIVFALIPAISEELFFRGLLLQWLMKKIPLWQAVVASACCFALFHVVTAGGLSLERLFPSLLMGLVLALVCWRSKSLIPGIFLHFLNNGLLFTIAYYREQLAASHWLAEKAMHLPWQWLCVSLALAACGCACFFFIAPKKPSA